MTIEELYSRWVKGPCKADAVLIGLDGSRTPFKMDSKEHEAPVGDLLKAYIDHLNTPWYKKDWYFKFVEKKFREIFNQYSIRFTGHI